jgi:hypothetical protein
MIAGHYLGFVLMHPQFVERAQRNLKRPGLQVFRPLPGSFTG